MLSILVMSLKLLSMPQTVVIGWIVAKALGSTSAMNFLILTLSPGVQMTESMRRS